MPALFFLRAAADFLKRSALFLPAGIQNPAQRRTDENNSIEPRGRGEALEEIHAEDVTQSRTEAANERTRFFCIQKIGGFWASEHRKCFFAPEGPAGEPAQKVLNFSHARARNRKSRGSLPGLSP